MKVLVLPGGVQGVNLYRLWNHAQELKDAGHEVFTSIPANAKGHMERAGFTLEDNLPDDWFEWALESKPDVIHTNLCSFTNIALQRLAELAVLQKDYGIPFVCDYDDANMLVPDYNQAYIHTHRSSKIYKVWAGYMKAAHGTTTTTPMLASLEGMDSSHITPNFVRPAWFEGPQRDHPDDIRVIFTGAAAGRWADLQFLRPLVEWMIGEYPQVKFIMSGVTPDWLLKVPRTYTLSWIDAPAFFRLLNYVGPDIGLAPLDVNNFNKGKSAIKYYEYGMVRAAGIYTALEPYCEVDPGRTGLVVQNEFEAWQGALARLIENHDERVSMANAAYEDVMANHTSGNGTLELALKGVVHDYHSHRRQPEAAAG